MYGNVRGTTPHERKMHRKYLQFMNNLSSSQLAALFPYIRFFYRHRANDNDKWIEHHFPFPMFSEEAEFNILKDRFSRGDGAGIENVTVNRHFPAYGNIMNVKINASFFFQNTNVLTESKTINGKSLPYGFSFLKLVDFLDASREQLVIEYGWGLSNFTDPAIIPVEMQDLIKRNEKKRWVLSYIGHDFDISQDGSVKLGVRYTTSQMSDVYMRNDVGVIGNKATLSQQPMSSEIKGLLKRYTEMREKDVEFEDKIKDLEKDIKNKKRTLKYSKTGRGGLISDVKTYEGERKKLIAARKKLNGIMNIQRKNLAPYVKSIFIDSLISNYDMFALTFYSTDTKNPEGDSRTFTLESELSLVIPDPKNKNMRIFKKLPPAFTTNFDAGKFDSIFLSKLGETEKKRDNLLDKLAGNLFNRPKGLMDKNTKNKDKKFGYIMFFPLRSLLAIAYDNLTEKEKEKYPFIGLGNIPARSLGHDYTLNLGDVLIEVETFQKWYHENYTSKNRLTFAFADFLDDIMQSLLPQAIYNSGTGLFGQNKLGVLKPMEIAQTTLTGKRADQKLFNSLYYNYYNSDLNKLFGKIVRPGDKKKQDTSGINLYTIMRNPSSNQVSPFLKINLSDTNFSEKADSEFGVSHIKIGANTGLLRNISFSATDFPQLRTALWAEGMKDSPTTRIRYKYSANIDLMGNNVFFKGGYFAISPNSLGLVDKTYDPGIVGYYIIQKVNDSISPGSYQTSVYGTWVWNPLMNKNRGEKPIEQETDAEPPPTELTHTVKNYIEELLSLDPRVLEQNGITGEKPDRTPPRAAVQDDFTKDIKEEFKIKNV